MQSCALMKSTSGGWISAKKDFLRLCKIRADFTSYGTCEKLLERGSTVKNKSHIYYCIAHCGVSRADLPSIVN